MKNLDFVLLLDCYGSLLTKRQRALLEGYYNEDLSLAELARPLGISRQAVHDSIRRGEHQLLEWERQMGIAKRLRACRGVFAEIEALSDSLQGSSAVRIGALAREGKSLLIG